MFPPFLVGLKNPSPLKAEKPTPENIRKPKTPMEKTGRLVFAKKKLEHH